MIRIYGVAFFLILTTIGVSQQTISGRIIDSLTNKPIGNGTIQDSINKKNLVTDDNGYFVYKALLNDSISLTFKNLGYRTKTIHIFLQKGYTDTNITVILSPSFTEITEVVVQSTRTNRNLSETPTRIEAIAADELDEKGTMKPGDIRMLLNESTGITTQTTSPVSGLASLRIQGLDGRYTQILKDGMPLYTGFSGGLGILQIAPLDLKQVEYIKGSASTLYGGGAIAGLVNLITKTPTEKPELSFLLNTNSGKGLDANVFYGGRKKNIGTTIFASYNYNGLYDPAGIGLTAIPKTTRFTFNPKLFLYLNNQTTAWFGVNTTFEDRYGGDIAVINGAADNAHQYFEHNKTRRLSTQISVTHYLDQYSKLSFKSSLGFLNRQFILPTNLFSGNQWSSFGEVSYVYHKNGVDWVAGLNEWTERFHPTDTTRLTYSQATLGAFVQNTYKISKWISIESGIRLDYSSPATKNNASKLYLLPRINGLFKFTPKITSRIGGGFGYKMPTPFIDEAEKSAYRNIAPINFGVLNTEKSYGINADINYRTRVEEFRLNVNQLFFYTRLDNPILLQGNAFVNAPGYLATSGAETNLKITLNELALYLGYSYTNAIQHYNGQQITQPLTAKHRLNADLTYEIENSSRFGLEAFYTSKQQLTDGTSGRAYITFGALAQKMWKHFSVFINVENLTDQRQTKWGSIYQGSITQPVFTDIYAPLDGRIVNAGIKIKVK